LKADLCSQTLLERMDFLKERLLPASPENLFTFDKSNAGQLCDGNGTSSFIFPPAE